MFERNRPGIRSYALVADTSLITAVANDVGYDAVFAEQLRNLASPGDLLVAISGSASFIAERT